MSIQAGQTIDRDTLNRAYVSKSATGTQIMAGSLRLLGGIQIDGATTLGSVTTGALTTGTINAGANNITTTGTISGTHSGSGASLTSLNATNLSSGTVADARLSGNVFLTNVAQTVTTNTTFSAAANVYFAGGTTYKIDTAGSALFNTVTANGTLYATGNRVEFSGAVSDTKISLWTGTTHNYVIGQESYNLLYGKGNHTGWNLGHKFYDGDELIANIGVGGANVANRLDSQFSGSVTITQNLDVQGEIKSSGANEFPDPLLASGSTSYWSPNRATISINTTQMPTGTNAIGSLQVTATDVDGAIICTYDFDAVPNEWITFSCYAFSTTAGKQSQYYIQWLDASKANISNPVTTITSTSTSWARYSITAQAPSNARYFRIRVDNDGGASAVMYFSAFQVERGRAMTVFKPYAGGKDTSMLYDSSMATWKSGNASITLSGQGSNNVIYLGGGSATVHLENVTNLKTMNVSSTSTFNGLAIFNGSVRGNKNGSALRIDTPTGYMDIGSQNSTWMHFYTDRARYFFDHTIAIYGGVISSFDTADLVLATGDSGSGGTARMTISKATGNAGIGITPHASYKLQVGGDIYANGGWLRTTGATGWYSESYGGGWYMTDTTWIKNYGSKAVYVNALTRTDSLQVGPGTAAAPATDLTVTSSSFNWRNVLWADSSKVAIGATSASHPLDVHTGITHQGINIQGIGASSAAVDALTYGISYQNYDGGYAWHIARDGSGGATTSPDLVFSSGTNSTLSSLTERFRLYNGGNAKIKGSLYVRGGQATYDGAPAISLAIGDNDTGFNWNSDGNFDIVANNVVQMNISNGTLSTGAHVYNSGSHYSLAAASGRGFRFWNSDAYKIHMSASSDATWGGNITGISATHDYNMYFRMNSATHGWAFQNVSNGIVAQVEANGKVHAKNGFRNGNFEMIHNTTEDSLDFNYLG